MRASTSTGLAFTVLAFLLGAGCGDRGRPEDGSRNDAVLVDGCSSIIVTNLDSFVVADDILGGEFDFICRRGSPRLEQVSGTRTLMGSGDRISRAEFVYDGVDGDTGDAFDIGPQDLTAGGRANRFLLDVTEASAGVTLAIRVFETAEHYSESTPLVVDQAGPFAVPFSEFTSVGSGARFDRVNQVTFAWELSPGSSIAIGTMRTAP